MTRKHSGRTPAERAGRVVYPPGTGKAQSEARKAEEESWASKSGPVTSTRKPSRKLPEKNTPEWWATRCQKYISMVAKNSLDDMTRCARPKRHKGECEPDKERFTKETIPARTRWVRR